MMPPKLTSENSTWKINQIEQILMMWMALANYAIQRIGRRYVAMEGFIQQYAQLTIIEQRIKELESIVNRKQPDNAKIIFKIVIIIAGAFTFTSAMRIFAASLGSLATPAALLGGILTSLTVDHVATEASTNYVCRNYSLKTLNKLVRSRHKQENKLAQKYWKSQEELVFRIEGSPVDKKLPLNLILGGLLSSAELVTAFWIVSQISFFSDSILVRLVASSLPVVLTWVASYIQAQRFGLPEYCAELLAKYTNHQSNSASSISTSIDWYERNYYTIAQIHAGVQNILDETSHPEHPTPELAETAFDIEYCQKINDEIHRAKNSALIELQNNFQSEIQNLSQEFPAPEIIEQGRSGHDIELQQLRIEKARAEWVEQELPKRKQRFEENVKQLQRQYENSQQEWSKKIEIANDKYDRSYQRWIEKNREFESIFSRQEATQGSANSSSN